MAKVKTNVIQAGGKTLMLPFYDKVVPKHEKLYDVFGGGAAILLWDVAPKGKTYNDINELAANYWRCCRDRGKYEELYRLLRATEYGRAVFNESMVVLSDHRSSEVQRAWAWAVHIIQGFTHQESEVGWRMAKPSSMAETWRRGVDRLPDINRELQNVNIECLDWRSFIRQYCVGAGSTSLVVCDPPYLAPSDYTLSYKNAFTIDDHVELLYWVNKLETMVIMCGYDSVLYQENLQPPDWQLVKRVRPMMVHDGDYETDGAEREECMWLKLGDWRNHVGGLWAIESGS